MPVRTDADIEARRAARRRAAESVPLLRQGFRPFFLGAALWAAGSMLLWLGLLLGYWSFAESYGGLAWHAHEFLFGYGAAMMTGFLLTAIPNWTGRLPVQGAGLLALALLWLCGRAALLAVDTLGIATAVVIDAAYLLVLTAVVLREIASGRNWRNLPVAGLVGAFAVANAAFHAEILLTGTSVYGMRLAVAVLVALIMLIGGRITPSFTRNWLARHSDGHEPAPFGALDRAALAIGVAALAAWVAVPESSATGWALIAAAGAQALRLARWQGARTWREPLVLILHVGFGFVPLGFFLVGVATLWPAAFASGDALHAWTTGAVGVMTLAVMTRATRGHTGRALTADAATCAIYGAVILASLARLLATSLPVEAMTLLAVSATAWIGAFALFAAVYGPMLLAPRRHEGAPPQRL